MHLSSLRIVSVFSYTFNSKSGVLVALSRRYEASVMSLTWYWNILKHEVPELRCVSLLFATLPHGLSDLVLSDSPRANRKLMLLFQRVQYATRLTRSTVSLQNQEMRTLQARCVKCIWYSPPASGQLTEAGTRAQMVIITSGIKNIMKHGYISRRSANYGQCNANPIVLNKSL